MRRHDPASEQKPLEHHRKAGFVFVRPPKVQRPFHRCALVLGPATPSAFHLFTDRRQRTLSNYRGSESFPDRPAASQQVDGCMPLADLIWQQDRSLGETRLRSAELCQEYGELPPFGGNVRVDVIRSVG